MILAMRLEMIHELQNTLAEDRNLNLWRTGVGLVGSVFCYYFVFGIGRQGHARIDTPRLVLISFFLLQHSTTSHTDPLALLACQGRSFTTFHERSNGVRVACVFGFGDGSLLRCPQHNSSDQEKQPTTLTTWVFACNDV